MAPGYPAGSPARAPRLRHRGTLAGMHLRRAVLVFVTAAACHGKAAAPAAPAPAAAPVAGTLKELQNGDRACYVVVDVDGAEQSLEGDFELCAGGAHDATALIGQRVTWTTEKAKVQAASCEGAPDCTASDEVDLIMTLTPAP